MDHIEFNEIGEKLTAKGRKMSSEIDRNEVEEGSVCSNQEQTCEIFKLNIDCFEESFDYLPFMDLISIVQTCKRLNRVAGYCLQKKILAVETVLLNSTIHMYELECKNSSGICQFHK